jgi:hypothetical protein
LAFREAVAAHRVYDWSNLLVGVFIAAVLAIPLPWLLPPHTWWEWSLTASLGILIALFLIIGASMVRKQPKAEDFAAASEEAETRGLGDGSASAPPGSP